MIKSILVLFYFLTIYTLTGHAQQNLIQNGDFEANWAVPPLDWDGHWINMASSKSEKTVYGYSIPKEIKAQNKSNFLCMFLSESMMPFDKKESQGSASFTATPIKVSTSKVYEVSVKVYYPSSNPKFDFRKHFGISFDDFKLTKLSSAIFDLPFLQIKDSLKFDTWQTFTWRVNFCKPYKFLKIGLYNPNPEKKVLDIEGQHASCGYFIDDVSMKEVNMSPSEKDLFCVVSLPKDRLYTPDPIEHPLDKNWFSSPDIQEFIKSYVQLAPDRILSISCFTDKATWSELVEKQIKKEVINKFNLKDKNLNLTFFDNQKSGIKKSYLTLDVAPYTIAISRNLQRKAVLNTHNPALACQYLKDWLVLNQSNKDVIDLELTLIKELEPLKSAPCWQEVQTEINKKYKKLPKPILAKSLDSLHLMDQRLRNSSIFSDFSFVDADTLLWKEEDKEIDYQKADSINLHTLLSLIGNSFPAISEVGYTAAKGAFFVLQHSNTEVMQRYLPLIEQKCKQNETKWEWYAMMFDRIETYQNKPQVYGTQSRGNFKYSLEETNKLRAKMGLEPIR